MRKITKLFHHSENTISTKAFLFCVTFNTKIVERSKWKVKAWHLNGWKIVDFMKSWIYCICSAKSSRANLFTDTRTLISITKALYARKSVEQWPLFYYVNLHLVISTSVDFDKVNSTPVAINRYFKRI